MGACSSRSARELAAVVDDLASIARLIDALRPWLGHLVLVGGWAHRLHRLHPLAHAPAYAPLRTRDADVAFSAQAPLEGDIGAALRAADFHEELSSEHTPPSASTASATPTRASTPSSSFRWPAVA